jgi:hypothetical protein
MCSPGTTGETAMLTRSFDRLKVISSGSVIIVVLKIDAKVCFPRWPSGGHIISLIGSKFGRKVYGA